MLIYFIHHVALSIQADEVIARVATELTQGIERIFPTQIGCGDHQDADEPSDAGLVHAFDRESRTVGAPEDGYLQLIEPNALMKLAVSEDVLLRVERSPGHYLIAGCPLVRVWPGKQLTDEFEAEIAAAFVLGSGRTPTQDVEFSIGQLVEIAVRALSPGVNDPFTAITCLDRLGSALSRLAQREMPSPYRRDEKGRLRVVTPRITFPDLVDAAFNQIRQAARSDAAVTIRLLETIALIAGVASRSEDHSSLLRHADMVARGAREGLPEDEDRRAAEERYQTARKILVDPGRSDR